MFNLLMPSHVQLHITLNQIFKATVPLVKQCGSLLVVQPVSRLITLNGKPLYEWSSSQLRYFSKQINRLNITEWGPERERDWLELGGFVGGAAGARICVSGAVCKGSFDVMSERGQWDQCEVVKSV